MVQEIVAAKPGFIIQYGTVFFLFTFGLVIIACWFIQYPDVVHTTAKRTSINAPKNNGNKNNGTLIKLFKKEG